MSARFTPGWRNAANARNSLSNSKTSPKQKAEENPSASIIAKTSSKYQSIPFFLLRFISKISPKVAEIIPIASASRLFERV